MKKREVGMDLVRSVAVTFVISVHYFLNNGFYSKNMTSSSMFLAGCARWLFFTSVPLFLLITGYLRGEDRPTKKYYCGIVKILTSWLIISVISIYFWNYFDGIEKSFIGWVAHVLDYKSANYSWYVEMYVGLFLILPYMNLAFHSIETRKGHNLMVGSICGMIFLPSVVNGWIVGGVTLNIIPNYWTSLYPFGFYLIGCYIRKYRPKIPAWYCLGMALLLCLFKGTLTYITAEGKWFGDGLGGGYSDLFVAATSVFIFLGLYRFGEKGNVGKVPARILRFVSTLTLETYLISWVFDRFFYGEFKKYMVPGTYLEYYIKVCIPIMVLSVLAAYPISWVSGKIAKLFKRIVHVN